MTLCWIILKIILDISGMAGKRKKLMKQKSNQLYFYILELEKDLCNIL